MRFNRFFEMSLVLFPTASIWWLFRPGYALMLRLVVSAWAVGWVAGFRFVVAPMLSLETAQHARYAVGAASVLSAMAFAAYMLLRSGKQAVQQEVSESLAHESNQFFEAIQNEGTLPTYEDDAVNLRRGEFIVYREEGPFYEYRTSGKSYSEGRSYRSFWGGGSVFRAKSQRDMTETLTETGYGVLYLTNQRVILLADKASYAKSLDQILRMTAQGRKAIIALEGLKKPIAIAVPNPFIPIGFQRFLRNAYLQTPQLSHRG